MSGTYNLEQFDYFVNDLMKRDVFKDKFCEERSILIYSYLREKYCEHHRIYHNLEHVYDCINFLHEKLKINDPLIEFALFFHDCEETELLSAFMAKHYLEYDGVDENICNKVVDLIMATDHSFDHYSRNREDEAIISSVDLSILGSAPDVYNQYVGKIKQEYKYKFDLKGNISDTEFEWLWQKGRSRFLNKMLSRRRIFTYLKVFDMMESMALRNLHYELNCMNDKKMAYDMMA